MMPMDSPMKVGPLWMKEMVVRKTPRDVRGLLERMGTDPIFFEWPMTDKSLIAFVKIDGNRKNQDFPKKHVSNREGLRSWMLKIQKN